MRAVIAIYHLAVAVPFKSAECVRQVGQYYVAFLPPKYVIRVRSGRAG